MKGLKITIILFMFASFTACKNDSKDAAKDAVKETVKEAVSTTSGDTDAKYSVDVSSSKINWEGSKPTGKHSGIISLKEGSLKVEKNEVTGGSFVIDMNSITVTDLEGGKKAGLEAHLKGMRDEGEEDHFFNVGKYPTGNFEITKVAKLANDANATHLIYGNLTLKDKTEQVGFKANIKSDGGAVKVSTPSFVIDRTKWGVNYGSAKIFDGLKDKAINDNIELSLELLAQK